MTQAQTPNTNTQNQAKPNNLSAIDKKIADDKAAEQSILQASEENRMQEKPDGKQAQPGDASAAPKQAGTSPAKN